jgi:hypothetical protein
VFESLQVCLEQREQGTNLMNLIKEVSRELRKDLLERDYTLLARLMQHPEYLALVEPEERKQQTAFLSESQRLHEQFQGYSAAKSKCQGATEGVRIRIAYLVSALQLA